MLIDVTQNLINLGIRGDGANCPVALAIKNAIGTDHVEVSDENTEFFEFGTYQEIDLPDAVCEWIARFDCGEPVEPMQFELEVPC